MDTACSDSQDPVMMAIGEAEEKRNTNLFLNYMNLVELPEEILNLYFVKHLYLKRNLIRSLPPKINLMSGLVELYMDSNSLRSLPEGVGQLLNLKSLVLNRNNLTELSESIGRLPQLQSLYVSHNHLTSLPASIGNITSLQVLNVMNNGLNKLPKELGNCTELQVLQVDCNSIRAIPRELLRLEKLEEFSASRNKLVCLPQDMDKLGSLEVLNIDANVRLAFLPATLMRIPQLEHLGVNRCSRLQQEELVSMEEVASILGLDCFGNGKACRVLPLKEISSRAIGQKDNQEMLQSIEDLPVVLKEVLMSPVGSCFVCGVYMYKTCYCRLVRFQHCRTPIFRRGRWSENLDRKTAIVYLYCTLRCVNKHENNRE